MKKKDKKPKVNPELEGLNIEVNSFGEIRSSIDISRINTFLDENVVDKKFEKAKKNQDKP